MKNGNNINEYKGIEYIVCKRNLSKNLKIPKIYNLQKKYIYKYIKFRSLFEFML